MTQASNQIFSTLMIWKNSWSSKSRMITRSICKSKKLSPRVVLARWQSPIRRIWVEETSFLMSDCHACSKKMLTTGSCTDQIRWDSWQRMTHAGTSPPTSWTKTWLHELKSLMLTLLRLASTSWDSMALAAAKTLRVKKDPSRNFTKSLSTRWPTFAPSRARNQSMNFCKWSNAASV